MAADTLLAAAGRVDVIDVAGRILANPARKAISASAAEVVALAAATEVFWAVCLEAELLVRALERTRPWDQPIAAEEWAAIAQKAGFVRGRMLTIRNPDPTEKEPT